MIMKSLLLPLCLMSAFAAHAGAPEWTVQDSHVSARLRGLSAASDSVAWASGSDNTVLHTSDGGKLWQSLVLPADMLAAPLDFRDVVAVNTHSAYLLSIGDAAASRIYKTTDSGAHWSLQYTNPDAKGFLDAMAFWDAETGLVIGDSIDGHLQILATHNGGTSWAKIPDASLPPALPNEGAFSGSGSNIAMIGKKDAWIALAGRVLHTADRGKTWTVVGTPIATSESAGIFSITFRDALHGVIVGGDYKNEGAAVNNVAITGDGGKTWMLVQERGLSGFRSAVSYVPGKPHALLAVGPTGADSSNDDGASWTPVSYPAGITGFDALSFAPGKHTGWVSGNKGGLARLKVD